jgi:hypothetical protein
MILRIAVIGEKGGGIGCQIIEKLKSFKKVIWKLMHWEQILNLQPIY